MNIPSGKITGSPLAASGGTFPRRGRGSLLRENPQLGITLPKLGRQALIKETQKIALQTPIKEAAHQQDTTERAVESQRNGESAMSLLAAVNMARTNPRARAQFAQLFGIPGYFNDPDFMEAWERFGEFYARQKEGSDEPVEGEAEIIDLFGDRA